MVYVFAIGGFLLGFAFGLGLIGVFLRSRSEKELVENKSLHRTYGLGVWVLAGFGAWAGVQAHNLYF